MTRLLALVLALSLLPLSAFAEDQMPCPPLPEPPVPTHVADVDEMPCPPMPMPMPPVPGSAQ